MVEEGWKRMEGGDSILVLTLTDFGGFSFIEFLRVSLWVGPGLMLNQRFSGK